MKILVMSDSHGNKKAILRAVETELPSLILHLGDHDADCADLAGSFPEIPVRCVRGNCDIMSRGADTSEFTFGGKKFFMTHGHLYGVKRGLYPIINSASKSGVDILLFGHTHIPHCETDGTLSIVNPGSVSTGEKTYAVLEITDGAVECVIKKI